MNCGKAAGAAAEPLDVPAQPVQPIIGSGAYSIVLGNKTSVFKLTIDRAAYALAEYQSQWQGSALPVIRGLHGIIGALNYGVSLFLIEMEPLDKLEAGTTVRKICLPIARQLRPILEDEKTPAEMLRRLGTGQPDE